MKSNDLIRTMLQDTMMKYSISPVTNRHAESFAEELTEDQKSTLRILLRNTLEDGMIDGFKIGVEFARELEE